MKAPQTIAARLAGAVATDPSGRVSG